MINLKVKPIGEEIDNCFLGVIGTVLNWLGKDYRPLLACCWYFGVKECNYKKYLADKIILTNEVEIKKILKDIYKIEYKKYICKCNNSIKSKIIDQLEMKKPVGFTINLYYCPWSGLYKKDKLSYHFLLITGYDEKYFYCIDNLFPDKEEKISFEEFISGTIEYVTFEYDENHLPEVFNDRQKVYNKVFDDIYFENRRNMIDEIIKFADIIEKVDIQNEMKGFAETETISIVRRCKSIEVSKYNFAKLIKVLYEKSKMEGFENIATLMIKQGEEWYRIKNMLVKAMYLSDSTKFLKRISDKIKENASKELEILERLKLLIYKMD